MEFCWIPAGEAQLGSPKEEQHYITMTYNDGKRPVSLNVLKEMMIAETELKRGKPKINGFWLGKYTVTQAEWQEVMGDNPSEFDGKKDNRAKGLDTSHFPVERVSWDDCQKFLEKVNGREGRGGALKVFGKDGKFVLPHEDQWEYACRGGRGNKRAFYFGNELNGTQANCDGDSPYGVAKGQFLGRTCAVDFTNGGKYEKHPWNLCHMSGNVWQWCENTFGGEPCRVTRGGGWDSLATGCRSSNRWARFLPDFQRNNLGFRVALVPSGQKLSN
jgi:formylglycine-generating enzyme required for sulfatase activity